MKKTPLAEVKDRFETKEKLVEAVEHLATDELWIDRFNEDKGLLRVSNQKLLRLYAILTEVKERFGSRAKLIDTILELDRRSKDQGLRTKYATFPTPRLLDLFRSASRRHKRAAAVAEPTKVPKKKTSRSKKAQAKVRAQA
ncbi:MAG: hypothetical protein JW751_06520 [Polyangiaceae bacterium]|nr:hypothetical protein [Polyangiaceae bacterium]